MGFLSNSKYMPLAYAANSFLQAYNDGQDRDLKRQMWKAEQDRQKRLDDLTMKQAKLQEQDYYKKQNQAYNDSLVAMNPGLLSGYDPTAYGPNPVGQLQGVPSPGAIFKAREAMTTKPPEYEYHDGQYYQVTPNGPVPYGERYVKPPSVKVDVNTGGDGMRVLKVDEKKGVALIADSSAPNGLRIVNLPGGETDSETKTRARTSGTAGAIAVRELDYILGSLGYDPETGKRVNESSVAGPRGRALADNSVGRVLLAGSDTGDFIGTLQSIKDTIAINRLLEIKASGAGLGQVPQSQLEALARALGNLNQNASDELLARNLMDVKRIYADVVRRSVEDTNDSTFSGLMESTTAPVRGGADADAAANALIQKYGGSM